MNKTIVTFYVQKDGDILAYFNKEQWTTLRPRNRVSYAHIGQHSECSPYYVRRLKKATPDQYFKLQKELEGLGYDLAITNEH